MELEKMARQLGAAIQQDEAYLNFEKARLANEADEELNDLGQNKTYTDVLSG